MHIVQLEPLLASLGPAPNRQATNKFRWRIYRRGVYCTTDGQCFTHSGKLTKDFFSAAPAFFLASDNDSC